MLEVGDGEAAVKNLNERRSQEIEGVSGKKSGTGEDGREPLKRTSRCASSRVSTPAEVNGQQHRGWASAQCGQIAAERSASAVGRAGANASGRSSGVESRCGELQCNSVGSAVANGLASAGSDAGGGRATHLLALDREQVERVCESHDRPAAAPPVFQRGAGLPEWLAALILRSSSSDGQRSDRRPLA